MHQRNSHVRSRAIFVQFDAAMRTSHSGLLLGTFGAISLAGCGLISLAVEPEVFCAQQKTVIARTTTAGTATAAVTSDRGVVKRLTDGVFEVQLPSQGTTTVIAKSDQKCCDHAEFLRQSVEALDHRQNVSVGGGAMCVEDSYTVHTYVDPQRYSPDVRVLAIANRSTRDVVVEQFDEDPRTKPNPKRLFSVKVTQNDSEDTSREAPFAVGYWKVTTWRGNSERCMSRPMMNGMMPGQGALDKNVPPFESDPQVKAFPVMVNLEVGCAPIAQARPAEVLPQPARDPAAKAVRGKNQKGKSR